MTRTVLRTPARKILSAKRWHFVTPAACHLGWAANPVPKQFDCVLAVADQYADKLVVHAEAKRGAVADLANPKRISPTG
jgi:hypothetical protein